MRENTSLYIHFPFCTKKCRYCDFYSITDTKLKQQFIVPLLSEIDILSAGLPDIKNISTIFFGGGTPSLFDAKELDLIVEKIHRVYQVDQSAEFTVECNPGTIDRKKLKDYKDLGINRLSIGIQSFDDNTLRFLGRIHDSRQALESLKSSEAAGFENISADLMFSVPGHSIKQWKEDLDIISNFNIKHISTYNLTYEPLTPLYRDMRKGLFLPQDTSQEAELYLLAIDILEKFNFKQYEISNFAKTGYECSHNLNYWYGANYIGLGPSAHSFYNKNRTANVKNLKKYTESIQNRKLPHEFSEKLSIKNEMEETIFLGLRAKGINYYKFKSIFNVDLISRLKLIFGEDYRQIFSNDQKNIKLTKYGRLFCDEISLKIISFINSDFG